MNRRDFFRGVGAAAASVALTPIPTALLPSGFWVIDDPGCKLAVAVEGSTIRLSISGWATFQALIEETDREMSRLILGRSVMEET